MKTKLISAFLMVDMGPISFYLDLKVEQDRDKKMIKLSQPTYIDKVLAKFYLDKTYLVNSSMKESTVFQLKFNRKASISEKKQYQSIISFLIFSIVETRLDITFAISIISQYAKNSSHQHTKAVKTILKYLKGSKHRGIIYSEQEKLFVERYSNLNQAKDLKSQKSTANYIFILNDSSISWCSKKQPIIALLSTEAKYIMLTLIIKKTMWIWLLFTKLCLLQSDQ